MRRIVLMIGLAAGLSTAAAGCGPDISTTNDVHCCVNGAYYSCASTNDAMSCADKCTRDSSKDSTCK